MANASRIRQQLDSSHQSALSNFDGHVASSGPEKPAPFGITFRCFAARKVESRFSADFDDRGDGINCPFAG